MSYAATMFAGPNIPKHSGVQLMVGSVDEALAFAQQRLRPFKQRQISLHQQQLLRETLALLAYPGTTFLASYNLDVIRG
jgi:hypothetical protein